jgi:hypothetical protein
MLSPRIPLFPLPYLCAKASFVQKLTLVRGCCRRVGFYKSGDTLYFILDAFILVSLFALYRGIYFGFG